MKHDIVHALRQLWKSPGYAAVTVLTLALGIGANTAIFSVVNGVVLKPLPYPEPDRLMFITSQFPGLGFDQFWISPPEFLDFRDQNDSFQSVGAYTSGAVNLGADDQPRRVNSATVTSELMPTLGVPESVSQPRLLAQLLGIFAGLALLLAAIGTYGILSYAVTERRREIGIHMALGATRRTVLGMILGQGLKLTAVGLVVGVAAALALTRLLQTQLFNVKPTDPATMAGVVIFIAIVAFIACNLPASRATRVDPMVVLRDD